MLDFIGQDGGAYCKSTWIWGLTGNEWECLYYGSFKNTCPCTSFSCDGFAARSGACKCAMESNPTNDYCYQSTKPCKPCVPGKYRVGCGCLKVETVGQSEKWICSEGECVGLPDGYYSVEPYIYPIKCPDGSFRSASNISCSTCFEWPSDTFCGTGQYIDLAYKPDKCCDKGGIISGKCTALPLKTEAAKISVCLSCDQCTAFGETKGSIQNNCAAPDSFFSRNVADGKCVERTTCAIATSGVLDTLDNSLLVTKFSDPAKYNGANWLPKSGGVPAQECVYAYVTTLGIFPMPFFALLGDCITHFLDVKVAGATRVPRRRRSMPTWRTCPLRLATSGGLVCLLVVY